MKLMIQHINIFADILNNDVIQPLCVILPQMGGYINYFDDRRKNMSFVYG